MDLELKGRSALVTGGTRGIGQGIVRELAREGAKVFYCGRSADGASDLIGELSAAGYDTQFIQADVTTPAGIEAAAAVINAHGGVDILVNNVGGAHDPMAGARPFEAIPADDWIGTFRICIFSAAEMTGRVLPAMRQKGWGRVINISSIVGLEPGGSSPVDYSSAKAAVNTMTVSLAQSLDKTGITANAVSPGPILTDALQSYMDLVASERGWPETGDDRERRYLKEVFPLRTNRMGRPGDIAAVVAFLASGRADFITGANIRVDGGSSQAAV